MVPTLVSSMDRIQYPPDKLEVIFVCESDDKETIESVKNHKTLRQSLFISPSEGPRTKPNALNHVLPKTCGEIITVYDAEDRPHPEQIERAARTLAAHPDIAVVQAPLTYYNSQQNWLTQQFTLEYAALFRVWLPFLCRLGLPFPLGGTSNHIRRSTLEAVGGWDEFNVTEDADLSFRFAAQGWRQGFINLPTEEEAVFGLRAWQGQRSRWMKGFMQTWAVHMSRPWQPKGTQAFARLFTLNLTIGLTVLAGILHVPFIIVLLTTIGLSQFEILSVTIPRFFIVTLFATYAIGMIIGCVGVVRDSKPQLIPASLLMPLYWLLLFLPTLQAAKELRTCPAFWNKTCHGLSSKKELYAPHLEKDKKPAM